MGWMEKTKKGRREPMKEGGKGRKAKIGKGRRTKGQEEGSDEGKQEGEKGKKRSYQFPANSGQLPVTVTCKRVPEAAKENYICVCSHLMR